MIRSSDLNSAAQWLRPTSAATPASRTSGRDAGHWFDSGVVEASIHGDVGAAARSLSVEQHAGRVLMYLLDEGEQPR